MNKMNLPVIVLKGMFLLPNNDIRLEFESENSRNIIEESILFHNNKILVVTQKNMLEEKISLDNLPNIGVIAKISHKLELPNGKMRVILDGCRRVQVLKYLKIDKFDDTLESIVTELPIHTMEEKEEIVYSNKIKREIENYINTVPYASNSIISQLSEVNDLDKLTDIIVPYLQIDVKRYEEYLYEINPITRMEMILSDIYDEMESFSIENEIDSKVRKTIDETQKNFLLREKIRAIKEELGDTSIHDDEVLLLREKIDTLKASDKVKERLHTELARYENLTISSPELNIVRSYIDWLLALPWKNYTIDNDDLLDVREKLDASHNGLDSVKTRIIEFLAVKQMTNSLRGPIICLVGPPGVGKTSLASSIASAIHRNFVKISVGGVNDEAELVGHRRTYLGANPGRIIQSLKKAKSSNPVFLIDEIDKMSKSYKGDPASVLLEILDPEQNKMFSDNYIEEEYDLSKVLFIATANYIDDIPEALKDRLEIVELSGYTEYEKIDIAKNHLIPKICKEHGVNASGVIIKDNVIKTIIREYTKEAGVRELERQLATIVRKIVTSIVESRIIMNKYIVDIKKLEQFLGKPKYKYSSKLLSGVGVVNGLAYTNYGGDILPIEVTYFKGNGNLTLTGSLGNVMKESATIALNYIKSNYKKFKINYNDLIENDIHIHIPEGAVKKDGPSAGIALMVALISAFANKPVSKTLALTGEITLQGNVIAIGGLKEKCIGAMRSGIDTIIIPQENKNDLEELPEEVRKKVKFICVKNCIDIINTIWGDE